MLTLQVYVLPLAKVAIPKPPSSAEKLVSITAPAAEQRMIPFLGTGDFAVIVNLKTSVPVVGATAGRSRSGVIERRGSNSPVS
jgi:hypothetical protein